MYNRRVTLDALAKRLDVSPGHLGDIRRGVRRPSDALKVKIQEVTRAIESEDGVADPVGVSVLDWFSALPSKDGAE